MKFSAFNLWKTIPRKTNLPQATWSLRSARRITAGVMALGLCAVGSASAAGIDGQLWYTAQQFLTTNSTNDNQVGSIFSDGSGQRRVLVSSDTSKYFTSVGLDRAAGFFFAINTDFNGAATLVVGNISTGAVIQTLSINPNDYGIEALAVNPVNHEVYIGIFGDSTTDTGIVQIPYNAVTGAVPTNIFTGSVISPSFYLTTESRGSPETFATSFSLDVANQKLYFTDEDIDLENESGDPWGPPWNSTNGIYVIDLNATTPIATQLSTAGQFPATNAGYHTAVESVAVDTAKNLIYFETINLTNGSSPNITLWYMPITGGTATSMTVPGSVNLDSNYYGTIALDPATQILYVSANGNSTTTPVTPGYIYSMPLSGDGHSFASGSMFAQVNSADPNLETTSLFFQAIPPAPATLTKSFGAPSVTVNGSTSLTFNLTNPNSLTSLSNVGFSDPLPSGLVVATPNGLTGSCGGGSITAVAGSASASLSGATLPVSGNCSFSVNVTAVAVGLKVNTTSTVSSTEGGSGTAATANLTVNPGPPQIAKSFGSASIALNGSTALSFTVSNATINGTSTGVAFSDSLPSGMVVSTPNGLTGSCGGGTITAVAGSGSASLSGATLAGGANCTFSVNVTGVSAGTKNNAVTVSSSNGGTGNTSNASLLVMAAPTISTVASASVTVSGTIGDSATLAGGAAPTGTITFNVFGPGNPTCSGAPAFTSSVTANGNGSYSSGSFTTTLAGTYSWTAAYSGDANNAAATGPCGAPNESVLVVPATPGIVTTASASVTVGGQVSDTAVLTSGFAPTGMLTLSLFGPANPTCTGAPVFISTVAVSGNGIYSSASFTTTSAGTYNWVASYSGDANNAAALSPCGAPNESVTISKAVPTLTTNASPGVLVGGQVSDTANLAAGNSPTGTITFALFGPNDATCTSAAAFTSIQTVNGNNIYSSNPFTTVSAGVYNWTATYSGDANNQTASGPCAAANESVSVLGPPTIAKTFGAPSIALNTSTSLSFTLQNNNPTQSLSGVGFTDTLPAGLVVSTPNGLTGTCGGGAITATAGSASVSLTAASLAASASCTFSVNVTGIAAGTQVNTTSAVTSVEAGAGTAATATLIVVAPPSIAKAFGAAVVLPGAATSLTFVLTNPATNTIDEMGVAFTDTMPTGLVVATPNALSNSCGGTVSAIAGSGTVSLSGGDVALGSSCTLSVNISPTVAGQFTNVTSAVSSTNGGTGNTATANLSSILAQLTVTIDDGQTYARYGQVLNYLITINNAGPSDANDIAINETLSPQFAAVAAHWICISGGGGASCTPSGTGPISDSGVVVPASRSVTWLVSVPVLDDAQGDTADNSVNVASQADPNAPYNVTDSDILVIFRDGFDVPYGDGTQSTPLLPALLQPLAAGQTLTLTVPPTFGSRPVDTLLRASALDGSGFRVERLNIGTAPRVRLISVDPDGSERPTDWMQTSLSAPLGVEMGENAAQVVLLTAKDELSATLTGKTMQQVYQVQSVGEVTQLH